MPETSELTWRIKSKSFGSAGGVEFFAAYVENDFGECLQRSAVPSDPEGHKEDYGFDMYFQGNRVLTFFVDRHVSKEGPAPAAMMHMHALSLVADRIRDRTGATVDHLYMAALPERLADGVRLILASPPWGWPANIPIQITLG